ncbi:hypothetical protein [Vibrio hepatarius]|uniref:hypothetical protein n=1 Tax=Vibrio hepatarius TaxID=171383 RepID=UPI001C0866AA|nr:hypothetical protein [Vibrio hepatarius]MBU2895966.1 hypothetical protein [Vibrio hepatarius]
MKRLISLFISATISAASLNFAQAQDNITVTNYIDGVSYQREDDGEVSKLLVSKNADEKSTNKYSISLKQTDNHNNFFSLFSSIDKPLEEISASEINKLINSSLSGVGESVVVLRKKVSKIEIDSIYGSDSFLSKEIRRCNLSEIDIKVKIASGLYTIKVNEMKPKKLSEETLHLLTFC